LSSFNPQNIENIVWAYATLDVQHHALFEKMGDHIDDLNDLNLFKSIANILWAYASLDVQNPALFRKMGDHIDDLNDLISFKPQ
jgi:predicted transcriptional regulator